MDFSIELKKRTSFIEEHIKEYTPREIGYQKTLFEAMNYSYLSGGKRLRPILLMEAYKISGGRDENYLPFCAALEMIHTYSLIHDDLPALDNDDLRRGRPTNHVVYGEAMAILAGDGLLNTAYEIMLENSLKLEKPINGIRASYEISKSAGINGMIGGQVVDIESENKQIDIDTLRFIHQNKTAELIMASVRAGAILAGCDDSTLEKLTIYSRNIGLSFQIVDDILDIEGNEDEIGKPIGSDVENNKSTYPSIYGLEESKKIAKKLTDEAIEEISKLDNSQFLIELAKYMYNRKK